MDSYKAFETLYGGVNMSKLQTLAYVSKLALGDTFARWTLVGGSAAIARFIISLLFGIWYFQVYI